MSTQYASLTAASPATAGSAVKPPRARRRWPPMGIWIFIGIVLGVNLWTHSPNFFDHAVANIILMVSTIVTAAVLLLWLAIFSAYRPVVRWTPLVATLVLGGLWLATHRVDHYTGELGLVWTLRWAKPPDEMLAVAKTKPAVAVALDHTTDNDFPQFLGPTRSAGLDRLSLARDWAKQPPERLWRQPIGAGHSGFVVVNGFAVTMEQRGEEELVTCYDALTGAPQWSHGIRARHETPLGRIGPRSTPTINAGRVYALGATGVFRCLDGANGKLLWAHDILAECNTTVDDDLQNVYWGRAASPLVVDNLVIVPGGGPGGGPWISLLAFDKVSGKLIWEGGSEQVSYSSPAVAVLAGVRQILIVNESNITGHDPTTGNVLWKFPFPGSSKRNANNSQVVPVGGDRLFVSKGYTGGARMFHVSRDDSGHWTADELWRANNILKTKFTNVAVLRGFAFGLSDGILECAELSTAKRQWKQGHYGHGQILRVGELLLIESEDGEIALVEASPEAFSELGRFQALDGQTWNTLCLWGRHLLVRNSEQAACWELPLAGH
ncbi:MAG TPA: PQQ-binding-like beta-propeller repeat protein [Pirellulales bacterium]|jgi:outer membrane protein assembly factor BamB|nr:PQQ-binding-like beta-propeller repeat protein [Pirellulales bacterium]